MISVIHFSSTIFSNRAAFLSGITFAVLGASHILYGGWWATAQTEVIMIPLIVFATTLLWTSLRNNARNLFWSGLLYGLAFSLKINIAFLVLALFLYALISLVIQKARFKSIFLNTWRFSSGFLLPSILTALYLAIRNLIPAFYETVIRYNSVYAKQDFGYDLFKRLVHNLWFWLQSPTIYILGLTILIIVIVIEKRNRSAAFFTFLWLAGIFLTIWSGRYLMNYHHALLLAPFSVITGFGISTLFEWIQTTKNIVVKFILALVIVPFLWHSGLTIYEVEKPRFTNLIRYHLDKNDRDSFLTYYTAGGDFTYVDAEHAAQYIKRNTHSSDSIFVWGFHPALYYLSGRGHATRFIFNQPYFTDWTAFKNNARQELLQDLKRRLPKYIVICTWDYTPMESLDWTRLLELKPLAYLIFSNWRVEQKIGRYIIMVKIQ